MKITIDTEAQSTEIKKYEIAPVPDILTYIRGRMVADISAGDIVYGADGMRFACYPIKGWKHERIES